MLNWWLINRVYAHTPLFSNKVKKPTFKEVFMDYLQCNFITILITAFPTAYLNVYIETMKKVCQG